MARPHEAATHVDRDAARARLGPDPPSDTVARFEHDHVAAGAVQQPGRSEPGQSRADHADVGLCRLESPGHRHAGRQYLVIYVDRPKPARWRLLRTGEDGRSLIRAPTSAMSQIDFTRTIAEESVPVAETFGVRNRATGEVFAQAPDCSAEQLDATFDAAAKAAHDWKANAVGPPGRAARGDRRRPVTGRPRTDADGRAGKALTDAEIEVFRGSHLGAVLRQSRDAAPGDSGRRQRLHRARTRPLGCLSQEWSIAFLAAVVGAVLWVAARWRRRRASRKQAIGAKPSNELVLLVPQLVRDQALGSELTPPSGASSLTCRRSWLMRGT